MPQTCHTKQPHCSQAHASLNLFIIIPILISNLGVRAHGQNPPLSPIHLLHSLPPRLHICSSIASYDTPHHLITKTHSRLGISPLPYRPTFFLPSYSYRTQPPPNSPKQNLKVLIKIKILGGCDLFFFFTSSFLSRLPGTFPFTIPIRLGVIGGTE